MGQRKTGKARLLVIAAMVVTMAASLLVVSNAAAPPASAAVPAGDIQVGENTLLRHDDPRPTRGRDAVGVAVNPNDPNHLVMANADLFHFDCEFHTSFDGGATWTSGRLRAPDGFGAPAGSPESPCSPIGHGTSSFKGGVGAVAFGSGNNVYVTFASARYGAEGQEPFALSALVARSTDGGKTFGTGVEALAGKPLRVEPNRFPAIAVVRRTGVADQLVVTAHDNTSPTSETNPSTTPRSAVATVSNDGGLTWSARTRVNAADQQAQELELAVGPDGTYYLIWRNYQHEGEIRIARSTDGVTWENFHVANIRGFDTGPPVNPDQTRSQFTGSAFPRVAVAPDGTVYGVYIEGPPATETQSSEVQRQDHFIHPDADVKLVRSADRGATWSVPVKVNEDPPAVAGNLWHQNRHATLSVAPNGRVDVVWHDRRHWYRGCQHTHEACDEARLGDTYWAHSTDGGQTFSDNVRITDRTQNNDVGSDYRQGVYWDFGPVSVPLGNDAIFTAWMDSRGGNFNTDALDIYYAKVALNAATTPIPVRYLPAGAPADLSAALAGHVFPGGSEATLAATFATRAWTRVVVVNQDDPAAALVGGVLARYHLGPVLASPAGGLTARLKAEAARFEPIGAFVLGNSSVLGSRVVSDLAEAGVPSDQITRVEGTPESIAAQVANLLDVRTQGQRDANAPAFRAAVIVNPDTDEGVTAAALAANRRLPFLFVERDSVPQVTTDALGALDIDTTLVVGGTSSVSDAVFASLPNPKRLGGADIYATSRAVLTESRERGLPANIVYVADGDAPMDAALTGAAAGRATGLLLLAPGAEPLPARSSLDTLGLSDRVDRFMIPGPLPTRSILSWACPEGMVPDSQFVDVGGHTHEAAIECVAWYGITKGGPGGLPANRYGPDLNVRRDQMATFIVRMIDHAKPELLPPASGDNPFPCDVSPQNPHYAAIVRLQAAEIVTGAPGGARATCYGPNQNVKRDQMASFIQRAIDLIGEDAAIVTDTSFFTDVSGVHAGSVNALASEGIVTGRSARTYDPGRAVPRGQMAAFIDRALDYLVQHEEAQRPRLDVR